MGWDGKISVKDLDPKELIEKAIREIGKAGTDIHKNFEKAVNDADDVIDDIAEDVRKGLEHANDKVEKWTGINFRPIVKAIGGPAHILVKIAEGHNLSEATTDWVVSQVEATSELTGWLGDDVEKTLTSIVSYSNVPLLLITGLAGDTVEVIEADEDIKNLAGFPLKAIIQQAHAIYDKVAKPIPVEHRAVLSQVVPLDILKRARFVVDRHPNNVAGLANSLNHSGSSRHAVTLDDIIVFSAPPVADIQGYLHWVHELKHVEQYKKLGVLAFAADYTKNYQEVEAEAIAAEKVAEKILADYFAMLSS